MERPLSAASSGTTPSIASGPTLKRNASTQNGNRSIGQANTSLFVTNLRLLNLDLLPDWPSISVASFGNQDARTRLKSTEYALYQLFRLYDPTTTADKLQPFFPPLEPLQSVNLRAALYRCLNELKKSGVFGKDIVLRKSMLDDCQGEKFWELCLSFSAVVLRRCRPASSSKHGKPVAQKLGMANSVSKRQKESMLPLAIAHRAALVRVVDQKQRKKETYASLYDLLIEKEVELRQRKVKSQEQAQKVQMVQPEKLRAVEQAIQNNWIGSTDLKDALIDGDTCPKGDGMLLKPFDKLWNVDDGNTQTESIGAEIGLLQSLNEKATAQMARLGKWQDMHEQLMASKPASIRSSRRISGSQRARIKFDRHQNLNLSDSPEVGISPPQQKRSRHPTTSRYSEILAAMREDLRRNTAHGSQSKAPRSPSQFLKRAQTQPVPLRKPSPAIDASPGARDPHARSPSQTSVPVRPPAGWRVSSRSKSYQQPKVVSQREPVPLKLELFSPLKNHRGSSTDESTLPSPAEEADSPVVTINGVDWAVATPAEGKAEGAASTKHDSGIATHTTILSADTYLNNGSTLRTGAQNTKDTPPPEPEFKAPALPSNKPRSADATSRPSLAERTRKSMAFNSAEDIHHILEASMDPRSKQPDLLDPVQEQAGLGAAFDRRTSLLDRTRQSISMAPTSAQVPRSKKSAHIRSRTSIYPINQFETPKKLMVRRSTVDGIDEEPAQRVITPIEKLLSPEAEYDSVFKSRPKIAMSPVTSPLRDVERAVSGGSVLLDEEVERSSPLVGVGARD